MIHYSGINHVAFATGDMDGTIRFWRDLLGMRLTAGIGKKGNRQYFFELSGSVLISFFEWTGAEPVPDKDPGRPMKGPVIFDHVCIQLNSENELWKLKDRLNAAGIWVTEVLDNGFIYSIFSTDPNGIQLEFCCANEKINIRDRFRMKDPLPSDITKEGPGPFPERWPDVKTPSPENEKKIYQGQLKKLFEDDE